MQTLNALDTLYDVELAKSLLRARIARGLTQTQLAEAMGVGQSYISQLENATVLPSHKNLKKIARILKAVLEPPQITPP